MQMKWSKTRKKTKDKYQQGSENLFQFEPIFLDDTPEIKVTFLVGGYIIKTGCWLGSILGHIYEHALTASGRKSRLSWRVRVCIPSNCPAVCPTVSCLTFDGPQHSFTPIDIKTVDLAANSYAPRTAQVDLHRHCALENAGLFEYFVPSIRRPPRGSLMRVCLHLWYLAPYIRGEGTRPIP